MNQRLQLQVLGLLLVGLAAIQAVPALAALVYGESLLPYATTAAVGLFYGLPLAWSARPPDRRMRTRDGFLLVSLAWLLASGFGALPYVLSGVLSPLDALFESVSGFTTTGSSVLRDVEAAPRSLLLWRSLSQWLGGMGIIVVAIAILPLLGVGGMQLYRAEMPGPVKDKLTPRVADTARRLWLIYLGATALAFACLCWAGMGPFDALCHALTTLATGGFSTRNASIGSFAAPAVEWVVIGFMLIASINFTLHFCLVTGRVGRVARDPELRFYLALVAGLALVTTWLLRSADLGEAATRAAIFQVVSLVTTTGFGSADYETWPATCRFLVLHMLVLGGMAGSTSGGLKALRVLLALHMLRNFALRLARPFSVRPVRYGDRSVEPRVVGDVAVFFVAYLALAVLAGAVVAAGGYDPLTSISAALTALSNVGPGLGAVGPTDHFAHLHAAAKWALCFCMIAGRLEIFTLLVLFEPQFWRR